MALFIVGSYAAKPHIPVYGAEWDGSSSPAWTRTDDAVGFTDPNPYYSGMSGTPSSPFDDISPWKDIRIVNQEIGIYINKVVEIPKFYYKFTRNGNSIKLQITSDLATATANNFLVSPAHADRGDGVGERDYVYVGRYHCSGSAGYEYFSYSGTLPMRNKSRSLFRTNIHHLGSYVWQWDYAMYWTIAMLYLVEFANWNSQAMIGYGCGDGSAYYTGYTNSMPYHTGTTQSSRTTYGYGTQYRYIEGLWDNVVDYVDGIYINSNNIYCIKNPSNFSDNTNGTLVGTRSGSSWITGWTDPSSVSGFEYALYPLCRYGSEGTYICDTSDASSFGKIVCVGGFNNNSQDNGLFHYEVYEDIYDSGSARYGSRLMVLPPSRLTA